MLGLNLKKIRKAEIFLHGFIGIVNESKRKPNKSWVGQRKQFHNSFMQKWLDDNGIWCIPCIMKLTQLLL